MNALIDYTEFDDEPSGILAVPSPRCMPQYSIRKIADYMKEKGIEGPLSDEELKQFRIEPKGFICREVKNVKKATHWMPTFESHYDGCEVTPYQLYRIFYDQYDKEHLVVDDNNQFSLIYLWHSGRFVVLDEVVK